MCVYRHAPAALPLGKRPDTHCTEGWVGSRAGLHGCGKSPPPLAGFDPRTVQPVASRYIDYAILTHYDSVKGKEVQFHSVLTSALGWSFMVILRPQSLNHSGESPRNQFNRKLDGTQYRV